MPIGGGAPVVLFNSPLETGLRALIVLDAFHPRACTASELTWFDHLVVHTADLDGPVSLHPDLPTRGGELLVRRRLVEDGIRLMLCADLVSVIESKDGVRFVAGDEAPSFVDLLVAPYCEQLKKCALWLADQLSSRHEEEIRKLVHDRLGRWTLEFQGEGTLHEPSA